jgi:hypothetical protein
MNSEKRDWTPEEVPQSFWDLVNAAQGDNEKFRALIADLPKERLREMYDQFNALAHQLFTPKHLAKFGSDASEDAWMDVANMVVSKGEDYYWDVYEDPEKTPGRDQVRGRSFGSVLVQVFADRFGEWI